MTKGGRVHVAVCVAFVAIAGVSLLVTWICINREPVYEGKPLSFWLTDRVTDLQARRKGGEVMRQIGTNGIPTLLRMTKARRASPLKRKLLDLAYKQSFIRIREGPDAFRQHWGAEFGFEILGTNAVSAVPELIKICADWRYSEISGRRRGGAGLYRSGGEGGHSSVVEEFH